MATLGKYTVDYRITVLPSGGFEAYAVLKSDDGQSITDTILFFNRSFATAAEALEHARARTEQRHADGTL
jgi:hypothetical protein